MSFMSKYTPSREFWLPGAKLSSVYAEFLCMRGIKIHIFSTQIFEIKYEDYRLIICS